MLACRSNTAPGSREGESKAGGHTGKQKSVSWKEQTQQHAESFFFVCLFFFTTCNNNRARNLKDQFNQIRKTHCSSPSSGIKYLGV